MHYAAVIPDNGHYYNMLQQLGANAKDLDDVRKTQLIRTCLKNLYKIFLTLQSGRSAEDYFKDPSVLRYTQLLSDFSISEEAAKEMLSDKGMYLKEPNQ